MSIDDLYNQKCSDDRELIQKYSEDRELRGGIYRPLFGRWSGNDNKYKRRSSDNTQSKQGRRKKS